MPSVLNNFVALRKTKGDVLDPTSHRTIIEMILGILKRYNFDEFNATYKDFIDHLLDFDDPHHTAETDFSDEIIARTYGIYVKMTATPVSEAVFQSDIVPTIGFLELIRRIVLNRYLYDRIKNPDGSVSSTVSVTLSGEWGHNVSGTTPVLLNFGSSMSDEDAFIARGWGVNATPIPVVFNANNLITEIISSQCIFHISPQVPYFGAFETSNSYPVALTSASNDLSILLRITGSPVIPTVVLSLLNGVNTFSVTINPNRTIELRLGSTLLHTAINCNEGVYVITMTRTGSIEVTTRHNGVFTSTSITADFSTVTAFVTALIGAKVSSVFSTAFGIDELTVSRDIH